MTYTDVGAVLQLARADARRYGQPEPDSVRRDNAPAVLELQECRAPQRIVDPGAVMERRIHVTIGRVKAAQPERGLVGELVADLRALQVDADGALRADLGVHLEQDRKSVV